MGFWNCEKDSDKTLFDHIGVKHVPYSIQQECKQELERRGYSSETIRRVEWENMD